MKDNFDEFEHNGFRYLKDYTKSSAFVEVEYPNTKPKSLYKFYPFNKFSVDAVLNEYFYASHPFDLNDVLDCSFFLLGTSNKLSYQHYVNFFRQVYKKEKDLLKFYEADLKDQCHGYIWYTWNTFSNIFGIVSLTGKENNPLMWPHYTSEKGFQLKFNTKALELSVKNIIEKEENEYLGLFPMNYSKMLQPIDISSFKQMFIPFFYLSTLKLDVWSYEDEWRFIVSKPQMGVPYTKTGFCEMEDYKGEVNNRKLLYNGKLVEEVVLGRNFFDGRSFQITRKNTTYIIKPINSGDNSNFEAHIDFLEYLALELSDRIYCSGVKYEQLENGEYFLVRTKERMHFSKIKDGEFELIKSGNFNIIG